MNNSNFSSYTQAELLFFNQAYEFCYGGFVKIGIKETDGSISIIPFANRAYKLIQAPYPFKFEKKEKGHLLCAFANNGDKTNDFMLLFEKRDYCENIYEVFCSGNKENVVNEGDDYFADRFLMPLVKQIKNDGHEIFRRIITDIVNRAEPTKKEESLTVLKATRIYNLVFNDKNQVKIEKSENVFNNSSNNNNEVDLDNDEGPSSSHQISNHETPIQSRKRIFAEIENHESLPAKRQRQSNDDDIKPFILPSSNLNSVKNEPASNSSIVDVVNQNIVWVPDFKFRGDDLIIIDKCNREVCYKYSSRNGDNLYFCIGCNAESCVTRAEINNLCGVQYVALIDEDHGCCPVPIDPVIYDEEEQASEVILHEPAHDKNYSQYEKIKIEASELSKNFDQNFAQVEISRRKEITENPNFAPPLPPSAIENDFELPTTKSKNNGNKKNQISKDDGDEKIIKADNFKIIRNTTRGTFLTTKNFKFIFNKKSLKFECSKCALKGKVATAILRKNDDGSKYVQLGKEQHFCKPEKKQPLIINAGDFEIFNRYDGDFMTKLAIFTSNEKNYCHEFCFVRSKNIFQCSKCAEKKKLVTAELFKDKNGNEKLKLNGSIHVCDPQKFIAENFNVPSLESAIYHLFPGTNGVPNNNLVIFTNENQGIGYEYILTHHKNGSTSYYCRGCQNQKKSVSVKICEDPENEENYLEFSFIKHVCKKIDFKKLGRIIEENCFKVEADEKGNKKIIMKPSSRKNEFHFKYDVKRKVSCFYKRPNRYICAISSYRLNNDRYLLLNDSNYF